MKNRGTAENALIKAFILAVSLGFVAHAGLGYLPQVGPPPLRFQVVKAPPVTSDQVNLSADTNLSATLSATEALKLAAVNPLVVTGQTNSTDDVQSLSLGAGNISDDPFGPAVFSLAPPDLLNITPQMLAAYFHPVDRSTNAAGAVMVPLPPLFMPPQPKPQPTSHAEYIVK